MSMLRIAAQRVEYRVALVAVLLTLTTATAARAEPGAAQTFATKNTLKAWTFSNGPEWPGAKGDLKWQAGAGRDDDGCAALTYDFRDGGNYVAAIIKTPQDRPLDAVRMWVKKPSAHLMIFRAMDSKGEVFQKNFRYHYVDWQQIEIDIDGWIFSWGGDGTFQQPVKELHILVENDGGDAQGTVLIDDLTWIHAGERDAQSLAQATYVEAEFGAGEAWHYDGASTGGFDAGRWDYAFSDSQTATLLHRDRSFLGKPQRMKLIVESDGSGHELKAWMGSHFQYFERTIGECTEVGTMEFEVPLGDMTTWRHFAGENDGIVRYPLRLTMLRLEKQGEQMAGTIRLKKLEVTTDYDPQTERAWVIPQASMNAVEDEVVFTFTLRSPADEPQAAELHYELDSADRRLDTKVQPIELPARGRPVTTEFRTAWRGASMLEGRFRVRIGDWLSPEQSTTMARLPAAPPQHVLNPDSGMGVGMYLYRFHRHPEAQKWLTRMCDVAARAGVKWTREEFHWNWIQPERDKWDFSYFDKLVDTATEHGISVYALCCYWTAWTDKCTDEGIEDYCKYLEALVCRYGDRIKHWEIWNEPNIFFWDCDREMYVKLLNRAYETIKSVDPNAQVLGCSTAGIDVKFIQMVLDHGGRFDALTVHPYRGTLDGPEFIKELRRAKEMASGREVWITEMGWPSNIGGLNERQQAQHVARTYISAMASDAVRSTCWYDFREDGDDPFYNEHNFGLVRGDLQPKMGYRALAAVGNLLGTAKVEQTLELSPGIVGWRFADGDQRVAALWSQDEARLVQLRATGGAIRFVNVVGDAASVIARDDAALVVLEPDTPFYVLGGKELELTTAAPPLAARVEPPTAHAGAELTLTIEQAGDMNVSVEPPLGWQVRQSANGYVLQVPSDSVPGPYVAHVVVTFAGQALRMPVKIAVVPELLRG